MTPDPTAAPPRPGATLVSVVVALMIAVMLSGCGKKGNTVPPPDEPNTYPQTYPKQ
jgi:predicted small lipoprotein YifL